jgi:GNAT superfamily N-acetyltransferase
MTLPPWHEESIARMHDRASFDCGDAQMNDFLRRFARQSHDQHASKTICAVDDMQPTRILGFYTIAPTAIGYEAAPPNMIKGLARHDVPGFKLARLATDLSVAGEGLGRQLLAAAARRCLMLAHQGGGLLLIIDAKSERTARWYESCGAERSVTSPLTLAMSLAAFAAGLRS